MASKELKWFLVATALVAVAIFFMFFEKKDAPDLGRNNSMSFKNKDPYGLFVFQDLLEQKYGKSSVVMDSIPQDSASIHLEKSTIIVYADNIRYTNVIDNGGDEEYHEPIDDYRAYLDAGWNVMYLCNRMNTNSYKNTAEIEMDIGITYKDKTDLPYQLAGMDTSFVASLKGLTSDSSLSIRNSTVYGDISLGEGAVLPRIYTDDGTIFYRLPYAEQAGDKNNIYLHLRPDLFSNVASFADFYPLHFNYVTDEIFKNKIYLVQYTHSRDKGLGILGIIMTNKYLKSAYYLMLFTVLIFLIFGSKRWMRPIPVVSEKENTSIQHVETMARLYELQNDNPHLVKKMRDNFYHTVQNTLYIHPKEENYGAIIAKKGQLDLEIVNRVLYQFDQIITQNACSDDQLLQLNLYVNNLEKKLKNGNT
jgi:hypothetical protein